MTNNLDKFLGQVRILQIWRYRFALQLLPVHNKKTGKGVLISFPVIFCIDLRIEICMRTTVPLPEC